ncbi:MAG: GreA/GreB family elongation factor [Candidatus Paceibacterota bacterium]|jgi:transcription elongation factor GreA
MKKEQVFVTKKGLQILKEKVKKLEEEYAEVSRGKMLAAEDGNLWHDNPAYDEVEEKQRMLGFRIDEAKTALINAVVVEHEPLSVAKVVSIGSEVDVEFIGGKKSVYHIVGSAEADPSKGIISYMSPLGVALMGAKEGETREYKIREKVMSVIIRKIIASSVQ